MAVTQHVIRKLSRLIPKKKKRTQKSSLKKRSANQFFMFFFTFEFKVLQSDEFHPINQSNRYD